MPKPIPHSTLFTTMLLFCRPMLEREAERVKRNLNRARKRELPATLTLCQWLHIVATYKWRCAICRTGSFETMEHLVPLCEGGGTTAVNCVPCCEQCNRLREQASTKTKHLKRQLADLLN